MASPVTGTSGSSTTYINAAEKNAATAGSQDTEQMFLQLLVAQIKNQDPTNPTDSVQFVSQLSQFSQLEQMIAIRQDADALKSALLPDTSAGDSSSEDSSTQGSSGS